MPKICIFEHLNHILLTPFLFSGRNTPRWIIFTLDLCVCVFSVVLALFLRFNFNVPFNELVKLKFILPFVLAVRGMSFYYFKTYSGIVRYTSTKDASRILKTIFAGSFAFALSNILSWLVRDVFIIPYSVIVIDFITSVFVLTAGRLLVKTLYLEYKNPTRAKTSVIIYGAGEAGIITKRTLDRDAGTKYKVMAFVDDNANKVGREMEGVRIHAVSELENLLQNNTVAHLIISIQHLPAQYKQEIVDVCLANNTKILNVPPVTTWINGELSFKQIKKVRIEDLLEREPIRLDVMQIKQHISGKRILVTGAAGSIGSEIVRQIVAFNPEKIILLDCAESPLYDIELELIDKFRMKNFETVLGDVRYEERMRNLFRTFRPEIVFHAAAYKHVPMMENNPSESILTNVNGTKIIADLSVEFGVQTFVMVSTDKAVNPTNIMGATKRIAEMYIQSLNKKTDTRFITTRFGNVLGSNGSVIPRFRKQIESGGPVTITHPDITRYFMTIPEACQLVLEAGSMGKGGEIFIFDMGDSVRISDLAKKMIKLSGLTLGKDIQIAYTGLRPGEKLYEELLNDGENTLPTHHEKIMIAKVAECEYETINLQVNKLIALFETQNNDAIVRMMKDMVPEFISNNSIYERLDAVRV